MGIILDSDVIIRAEKNQFDLASWLEARASEPVRIAAITVAEIRHGVERATGDRRHRREEFVESVISALPVVPYTTEVAREHARIWAELQAKGQMIGFYDVIVAATARLHGTELATFNNQHFDRVSGLKIAVLGT